VVVDPSPRVEEHETADERHRCSLEEFAEDHPSEYDVAFAVFVLEHVRNPDRFMTAAGTVLRPRGSFFAVTVNQWHYFGLAGWASTRLGVSDRLLPRLRDPHTVAEYHVPTEYRLNTIRVISRHLEGAGFASVEFRMWDLPRLYRPYLPRPLHGLTDVWHTGVYRTGVPELMGHLTFRAIRAE
jgi:SAM-dependent methyltransferase